MRIYDAVLFGLVVSALGPSQVWAQDARSVEVTPYLALGTDAVSPVGVALTFPVAPRLSLETEVAYRRGEGNIRALSTSASLLWRLPRVGQGSQYLAAGVGLAQYGTPVFSQRGSPPIGTRSTMAMTVNAGGGLKMPLNDNLDWRTDVRWLHLLGQGSDQFRVAQGLSFDVGKR